MKVYSKIHQSHSALVTHYNQIKERGGFSVFKKNQKGDYVLTYWFEKESPIKPISVTAFNKWVKGEVKRIKEEYGNDLLKINSSVAFRFMEKISDALGAGASEIDWANESKKAANHFQLTMETGDVVIWATFVYVDDKHNVVAERCNIELLTSNDYETICKIPLK
jgi:hypothetical protein